MIQDEHTEIKFGIQLSVSSGDKCWHLTITDKQSNVMILRVYLSAEEMGTALAMRPVIAKGEMWHSPHHGKTLETSSIMVEVSGSSADWEEELDRIAEDVRDITYDDIGGEWALQRTQWDGRQSNRHQCKFDIFRWV